METKVRNIITIIGIVIAISFAITALLGYFNPVYEFVPPIILTDEKIIAVQTYFDIKTGELIREVITNYGSEMNLIFRTTALSAQNPITVEATLDFLDLPNEAWIELDQNYYMIFPFAVNSKKSQQDDNYYTAIIPLEKNKTLKKYYGDGEIKYTFEGEKPFFVLLTWDELKAHTKGDIAKIPESYLKKELEGESLLRIEPSSTTTTLQTNNIIITLTFVVIAFGIMEFRISAWKE